MIWALGLDCGLGLGPKGTLPFGLHAALTKLMDKKNRLR